MTAGVKCKLVAGFVLVFVAGGVTGGFIYSARTSHHFLGPPYSGRLADRMTERLRSELKLTSDQLAKLSPIIDETASKLEAIRTETAGRVRQTITEAHQKIFPNLTPEQQSRLNAMDEKHRRHAHQRGFSSPSPNQPTP